MFHLCLLFLILLLPPSYVVPQAFHTVIVGDSGSFYDPPTISALQGDVITFIFSGRSHSVTQSSFAAPCTRLQGGFDSDSWGVKNPGDPVPQWNLTITKLAHPTFGERVFNTEFDKYSDTMNIWFYCKNTLPLPHCTAGMVGAINPPTGTDQNFTAFRQAAKAIQGTPVATPGAVLTGVGASASAVPFLVSTSGASTSTSSSSSTSSTTSQTAAATSSSSGGISSATKVGAAVGASLGAVIVIGAIALLILATRRRQQSRERAKVREMYDGSTVDNRSISWAPYNNQNDYPAPVERPMGTSVHSPADSIHHQAGHTSMAYSQDAGPQTPGSSVNNTNVRELAAEIASLIKSSGSNNNGGNNALAAIDEDSGSSAPRAARPLPPVSQSNGLTRNRSQETLPVYTNRD